MRSLFTGGVGKWLEILYADDPASMESVRDREWMLDDVCCVGCLGRLGGV